jgi:peptidoglycan/LPS O-acetylase OafA/YrhL
MAAFQHRIGLIFKAEYVVLLIGFGVLSRVFLGWPVGLIAVGTAVAISFLKLRRRWLLAAGAISYSVYLLHVPIGGRVINLSMRLPDSMWIKVAALGLALLLSLASACLLWKFVERPALQWAARLSSGKRNEP